MKKNEYIKQRVSIHTLWSAMGLCIFTSIVSTQAVAEQTVYDEYLASYLEDDSADSAQTLLDEYALLSESERKKQERTHFNLIRVIEKKYPRDQYVQTGICWNALMQNQMDVAQNACLSAYQLDFMYAPAVMNMGHIHYYQGQKSLAKSLYSQSLVAENQGYNFVELIKQDFDLPIYSKQDAGKLKHYIDKEDNSRWKKKINDIVDLYSDDLASDDYTNALPKLVQHQQAIEKQFGKNALINGYMLQELGKIAVMEKGGYAEGVKNNPKAKAYFKQAKKIFKKNSISQENSLIVDDTWDILK